MKYNELQVEANKNRKRVGRGIAAGQGKTAGRGTKGQNARTGKKLRATFAGGQLPLVQAIPKKRGFKSKRTPAQIVYLEALSAFDGRTADNAALYAAGLIQTQYGKTKVIARGELTAKVQLKVQSASASVQEAITKAGGSFEKVPTPKMPSTKPVEAE